MTAIAQVRFLILSETIHCAGSPFARTHWHIDVAQYSAQLTWRGAIKVTQNILIRNLSELKIDQRRN
jgi:hypothetical protein